MVGVGVGVGVRGRAAHGAAVVDLGALHVLHREHAAARQGGQHVRHVQPRDVGEEAGGAPRVARLAPEVQLSLDGGLELGQQPLVAELGEGDGHRPRQPAQRRQVGRHLRAQPRVLDLDRHLLAAARQHRPMYLSERRGADRGGIEGGEDRLERSAELLFEQGTQLAQRDARIAVLTGGKHRWVWVREHVIHRGAELAQLSEETTVQLAQPQQALRRTLVRAAICSGTLGRVLWQTRHPLVVEARGQCIADGTRGTRRSMVCVVCASHDDDGRPSRGGA